MPFLPWRTATLFLLPGWIGLSGCQPVTPTAVDPVKVPASPVQHEPTEPADLVVRNAAVITMVDDHVLTDHAIAVRHGLITWIGPTTKAPAGKRELDVDDAFVVPGLIDMHVHLEDSDELDLYLLNGVTTVMNLSGTAQHLAWRDAIATGKLRGPTIYTAGPTLDGDPARNGRFVPLGTPEAAHKAVDDVAAAGYDMVKIYDLIQKEPYQAAVEAAKVHGLPVVGHLPKALGLEGVLGGHDLIAHAEEYFYTHFAYAADETKIPQAVEMTRKAGIAVCPNTGFIRAIIQQAKDLDSVLAWPEVRYLPPDALASWLPETNRYLGRGEDWLARNETMYPFLLKLTKALSDGGVLLVTGTDASVPGGVPGFALHRELEDLRRAGLTQAAALAAATRNPGQWLEDHLALEHAPGQIAPGRPADLLVVPRNPLHDLTALQAPTTVISKGTAIETSALRLAADARAARYAEAKDDYDRFKKLVASSDYAGAEALLRTATASAAGAEPRPAILGEDFVNAFGYALLSRQDNPAAGVMLFLINTRVFPDSANAWDSLGEGYKAVGRKREAIRAYRKSLDLEPANANAKAMLRELAAGPESKRTSR